MSRRSHFHCTQALAVTVENKTDASSNAFDLSLHVGLVKIKVAIVPIGHGMLDGIIRRDETISPTPYLDCAKKLLLVQDLLLFAR